MIKLGNYQIPLNEIDYIETEFFKCTGVYKVTAYLKSGKPVWGYFDNYETYSNFLSHIEDGLSAVTGTNAMLTKALELLTRICKALRI